MSDKNQNELKNLENLKISDEGNDSESEDEGNDDELLNNSCGTSHKVLEELIAADSIDLINRGRRPKKLDKNPIKSERPLKPKPETSVSSPGSAILIHDGNVYQIINGNGVQIPAAIIQNVSPMVQKHRQEVEITAIQKNLMESASHFNKSQYQQRDSLNVQQQTHQVTQQYVQVHSPQQYTQVQSPQQYGQVHSPQQNVPSSSATPALSNLINSSNDLLYNNLPSPYSQSSSVSNPNTPSQNSLTNNDFTDDFLNDFIQNIQPEGLSESVIVPDVIPVIPEQIPLTNNIQNTNQDEHRICSAEISLLPRLENIIKLKKERGETFIHQLAQSKHIMHSVSRQALNQLNRQNNSMAEMTLRLTSNIFMEHIIYRALQDQINNNQPTLLYEIVNVKNEYNETPLILAVQKDRDDFTKLLVENSANPNIFCLPSNHTALHKACIYGSTNSFKIMMDCFYLREGNIATINQIDADGNTALALAIKHHSKTLQISNKQVKTNNMNIIQYLINCGANTKMLNFENNSCIHLLCQNDDCTIEDRLRILKLLKVNLTQLTAVRNIYGCSAWETWTGLKLIEQPQVLLEKVEQIEIPALPW